MQLALFDLDNTLLAGDSDYEWTRFLVAKGVLDEETFQRRNDEFLEQYKRGALNIAEFLDFQLLPLAKNSRADLDLWLAEYVSQKIIPMIGQKARDLIRHHQSNNDICAIVTATNSFITSPICREFGIPHLIATVPAQKNGRFTGKARGIPSFREGKVKRVEAWLESMGLWWGSFECSWFYSDSFNDLPLMKKVTNPVAVDPDTILLAHAKKAGWPVLSLNS